MPHDKKLHLIAGALICFVGAILFGINVGFGLAIFAGIVKEVYDHFTPGYQVEFLDFIATFAGGLAIYILFAIAR
jgi:cell division protein FtsX